MPQWSVRPNCMEQPVFSCDLECLKFIGWHHMSFSIVSWIPLQCLCFLWVSALRYLSCHMFSVTNIWFWVWILFCGLDAWNLGRCYIACICEHLCCFLDLHVGSRLPCWSTWKVLNTFAGNAVPFVLLTSLEFIEIYHVILQDCIWTWVSTMERGWRLKMYLNHKASWRWNLGTSFSSIFNAEVETSGSRACVPHLRLKMWSWHLHPCHLYTYINKENIDSEIIPDT